MSYEEFIFPSIKTKTFCLSGCYSNIKFCMFSKHFPSLHSSNHRVPHSIIPSLFGTALGLPPVRPRLAGAEAAAAAAVENKVKVSLTDDIDEVMEAAMTINQGIAGDEDFLFDVGGDDMFDFDNDDITEFLG